MTVWSRLWIAWGLGGVGSALAIIALQELNVPLPPHIWRWWAVPGLGGFALIEGAALLSPARGDTLSEHVWNLRGGFRSLSVTFMLWVAFWLASGNAWPSSGVFGCLWVAYHFWDPLGWEGSR